MTQTPQLVPIRNFAQVRVDLFRGAQPQYKYEYLWLKQTQGINTIINLRAELDHDAKLVPSLGMNHVVIPVEDKKPPTLEQAQTFIEQLRSSKGNTFFHCAHGHGRTSLFTVIARMAEGWALERALQEETDRFGYTFKYPHQLEFLKGLKL